MSNSLVEVSNNQIVTDSRRVAEVFGKEHKNVLRSISEILVAQKSATKFFYETEHEYRGQKFPMYLMNRDGFSLLVMGFNGKKALEWKVKYIEAFNEMEKQLTVPKLAPNPHYRTRLIKTAVKDIGGTADAIAEVFGVKKGMATAALKMVGEAYGIDTEPLQTLLPAEATPGLLTPTGIAKALGIVNGKGTPDPAAVNCKLTECD
ncbi:Rha family transcriptional regulator [Selenomonas sp. AE3005]|uniref:Rha family transcriptional regulator n=1 Tax=Selenomonas sp. AE3005 TaxID=1485543 RepID=UPI000907D3B5|nr:Rha family transcriptional regulator [Selenomonas sp. AE3005]